MHLRTLRSRLYRPAALPSIRRTFVNITLPIDDQVALDHKEINTYYHEYEKRAGTPDEAKKWYHQFAWAVARHKAAAQVILYPLIESKLGEYGTQSAAKSRAEHLQTKILLTELEGLTCWNPDFPVKMKELMTALENQMRHEESEELPKLKQQVPEPERIEAGVAFERRKLWLSPTRPHPLAPEKPVVLESLVDMLAAPIDKLKDLFREFPSTEEVEKVKPTETSAQEKPATN